MVNIIVLVLLITCSVLSVRSSDYFDDSRESLIDNDDERINDVSNNENNPNDLSSDTPGDSSSDKLDDLSSDNLDDSGSDKLDDSGSDEKVDSSTDKTENSNSDSDINPDVKPTDSPWNCSQSSSNFVKCELKTNTTQAKVFFKSGVGSSTIPSKPPKGVAPDWPSTKIDGSLNSFFSKLDMFLKGTSRLIESVLEPFM
ncbi:hypothetical protein O0L34_g4169 [Tuta absoluta]|nr:hypothetical protein O0L34_g4169 [Tuta absoluta]